MTGAIALPALIALALGAALGRAYLALLRVNVRLYVARRAAAAIALHVARLGGAAVGLGLAARAGAPALLAAAAGFTAARRWALRAEAR